MEDAAQVVLGALADEGVRTSVTGFIRSNFKKALESAADARRCVELKEGEHDAALRAIHAKAEAEVAIQACRRPAYDARVAANLANQKDAPPRRRSTAGPRMSLDDIVSQAVAKGADASVMEHLVRPLLASGCKTDHSVEWACMLRNALTFSPAHVEETAKERRERIAMGTERHAQWRASQTASTTENDNRFEVGDLQWAANDVTKIGPFLPPAVVVADGVKTNAARRRKARRWYGDDETHRGRVAH